MNTLSHVTEADLDRLSNRLSSLERKFATLASSASAPAALPVDKMQLADYGSTVASEDEEDEEEEVTQPNISRSDLQELTSAVHDFMDWLDPRASMSEDVSRLVTREARERLLRAVTVVELELRRSSNA